MVLRITAWTFVVPRESFVEARRAADVVAIRIAIAPQDVDESGSHASHVEVSRILRASVNWRDAEETALMLEGYADTARWKRLARTRKLKSAFACVRDSL